MNPVSNGPHSRKAIAGSRQAEVAGGGRELRAGDRVVLAARHPLAGRPETRRRADRSLHAAGGELRREGRIVRQLGALDSVEVEGHRPAGRRQARSGDRGAALSQDPRPRIDRKAAVFPDPILNLNWWYTNPASPSLDEVCKEINGWALEEVRDPAGAVVLRPGQQLSRFLDTRADGIDDVGQLALYRDVHRCGQSDPAPLVRRSERPRTLPGVDRQLARQPAHSVQPLFGRRPGEALGCLTRRHRLERSAMGRRHTRLHRRQRTRRGPRRVHHAARGRGAALRAGAVRRRAVVGALRARRIAGAQSAASVAQLQSGGEAVHHRVRRARQAGGIPDRLHHLPAHRALSLLDQEQPVHRPAPAGVLRRDPRAAGAARRRLATATAFA